MFKVIEHLTNTIYTFDDAAAMFDFCDEMVESYFANCVDQLEFTVYEDGKVIAHKKYE